ncbi:hemolysin type calcium-binding protein [Planktotalea frisia]|mgnify:CR=1 FL=1|jgi:hypothetical protein|uniref:Hemolysin, chromosomal n=1 Tax=Planktotalea frisia TaxID=696762 RepID=A0A1L9NS31_9RHOB|nr:calcium-binding protein [Planktotalea frisia]OJI92118.1 hemolysin, chromosomal [Planktotalea frisia]PZX33001.1 hemolysin type calcium-binding protein [Planktotalea frisia]
MSAMMIILLSSLTLFGAILIDPVGEEPEAEPDVPEADPVAPGEDANNPLDEAVQETPSDEADTETETVDDSSEETQDAAESDEESGVEVIDETDTGNQSIFGSLQSDTIDGEAGDDTIDGRLGDDTIEGGLGVDQISGGEGADVLFGGTINSQDDGAADTLLGGEGDDRLNLENTDVATGGAGADTFVRLATMSERALVTDFDTSEDVVVVEHQSDEPPTLERQTIATDGVILELSDGSRIELAGLTEAVDASLISFVDTRTL